MWLATAIAASKLKRSGMRMDSQTAPDKRGDAACRVGRLHLVQDTWADPLRILASLCWFSTLCVSLRLTLKTVLIVKRPSSSQWPTPKRPPGATMRT